MASNSSKMLRQFQESTVEAIWNALKTACDSGIQQFVPIKKLSSKCSLPKITQEIRRLLRKRDKLNQKQKSGSGKDRCHFKRVKHLVQLKIKKKILMKIIWRTYLGWVLIMRMKSWGFS